VLSRSLRINTQGWKLVTKFEISGLRGKFRGMPLANRPKTDQRRA
jgi:hypothetical protein